MNIVKFYNNLSDKEKKLFHITLGVVLIAMFDALFFRPVSHQIKTLEERIRQARDGLNRDLRFLSYKDKIMAEAESLQGYDTAEGRTNDEEIIAEFLKSVERMASEKGVNLIRLNPLDVDSEAGWRLYLAEMTAEGKTEDILRLLHDITVSKNLLSVRRFSLTRKKTAPDTLTLVATLGRMVVDPESMPRPVEEELKAQGIALPAADDHLSDQTPLSSRVRMTAPDEGKAVEPPRTAQPGRASGVISTKTSPRADQKGEAEERLQSGRVGRRPGGEAAEKEGGLPSSEPMSDSATGSAPPHGGASSGGEIGATAPGGVGGRGTVGGVSATDSNDETESPRFLQGERIRIKSLGELWREFWGLKPKTADLDGIEGEAEDGDGDEERPKRNIWQRLFRGR